LQGQSTTTNDAAKRANLLSEAVSSPDLADREVFPVAVNVVVKQARCET